MMTPYLPSPPFPVTFELPGWDLFWAQVELASPSAADLAKLREAATERARATVSAERLAEHPPVAGMRKLFRAAGCDPTRYRPAGEALLRRVLKGSELPEIHPLVDLNNCLSLGLGLPCCVAAEGTVEPPITLRAAREGESYESLRGPFNLAKKPILVDQEGPYDTPITGSQRVKVTPNTTAAWLVAYLPRGVVQPEEAHALFASLVDAVSGIGAPSVAASLGEDA